MGRRLRYLSLVPFIARHLISLRDAVVFPRAMRPLTFGRGPALLALQSLDGHDVVVLATQRDPKKDEVALADVYPVGVTARVLKVAPTPEQRQMVAIVVGIDRVRIPWLLSSGRSLCGPTWHSPARSP